MVVHDEPHVKIAAIVAALLTGSAPSALRPMTPRSVASSRSKTRLRLRIRCRVTCGSQRDPGPSPAVVLLHSCNGDWRRLDERWGKRIASWGYVTLTVDRFGPRGINSTCTGGTPPAIWPSMPTGR